MPHSQRGSQEITSRIGFFLGFQPKTSHSRGKYSSTEPLGVVLIRHYQKVHSQKTDSYSSAKPLETLKKIKKVGTTSEL